MWKKVSFLMTSIVNISTKFSKMLECLDLPVHCVAYAIIKMIMALFAKRSKISRALFLLVVIHQLNATFRELGHFKFTKGHLEQAKVTEIYKDEEVGRHVVYLTQHVCPLYSGK